MDCANLRWCKCYEWSKKWRATPNEREISIRTLGT
nr:unnamed protein product [Callosobruchus chinensis]